MRNRALLRLEAGAVRAALRLVGALSPQAASNLGGAAARTIGPLLPVSRVADSNLRLAMPDLDAGARKKIVRAAWDNLGRTVGELPHLPPLRDAVQVVGVEHLAPVFARGGPAILFSGHVANWELAIPVAAAHGLNMGLVYRAPSNPIVDALLTELRREAVGERTKLFPKGAEGARGALAHLKAGGVLGLLIDQKMNDGISVPFFGHAAMTAPAGAALALRFRAPLYPAHLERLGPARYRIVVEPALAFPDTGERATDIAALTAAMNAALERWIRARPAEWLWLHRRWPQEHYR